MDRLIACAAATLLPQQQLINSARDVKKAVPCGRPKPAPRRPCIYSRAAFPKTCCLETPAAQASMSSALAACTPSGSSLNMYWSCTAHIVASASVIT